MDSTDIRNQVAEYNAIVQKMGSNEAWAYSFVALYFAFLASLGAASGFLLTSENTTIASLRDGQTLLGIEISLFGALAILGLSLNIWAISMVLDYKITTRALIHRLAHIEDLLGWSDEGPPGIGRSNLPVQHSKVWRAGQLVIVGSVMALFFLPWIVLLLSTS